MPTQPCPACGRDAPRAMVMEMGAALDDAMKYYRCAACGHVWIVFKNGRPIHHVTPLRTKPPEE